MPNINLLKLYLIDIPAVIDVLYHIIRLMIFFAVGYLIGYVYARIKRKRGQK